MRGSDAGEIKPGCWIIIGIIFLVFFAALGLITWGDVFAGWEGDDIVVEETTKPPANRSTTSAPPPATCADDTAAFRAFAGSRPDAQPAVINQVTLVCWTPAGALRAEAGYSGDVNPASPPLTWLCQTLSGFIEGSGRPFQPFTVYSTHAATPGSPVLAGGTPGGACIRPPR